MPKTASLKPIGMKMEEKLDGSLEIVREAQIESSKSYDEEASYYWDNLSVDDRLRAFYSVCKRVHSAEFEDKGSYRFVLYNVFGFNLDAYAIGMECGFMAIHNALAVATDDDPKLVKVPVTHLKNIRTHLEAYRSLLFKMEVKSSTRKISNIQGFELLETQHLIDLIDYIIK